MSRRTRTLRRTMNGKRAFLLVAVLGSLCGGVYAANRAMVRRNAHAMLDQARKAEAEGNTAEAGRLYTDYLNFQPKDADALAGYAAFLEATGNNKPKSNRDRADTYERLLKADPTRHDERRKLVKLYLAQPFYIGAAEHVEFLLDPTKGGTPDDPELLTEAAVCELGQNHPAEAAVRLRTAVATKRAGSETYALLAHVLRNELKTPEAVTESDAVLDQLAADRPDDISARLARARALLAAGKTAEAKKSLGTIQGGDTNPDVAAMRADLFLTDQKYSEARDTLVKASAAHPNDSRLRLMLADVYGRLQDKGKAKQELEKATASLPDDGMALLDAVDRKIDYGMLAEARRDVDRFAKKEEFQPATDYLTGRLLLAEGNWPAALNRFARVYGPFERLPRFLAKARVAAALCYRAADNADAMLANATAATKVDPVSPGARLAVAEANARLGRWADAVAVYKQYADRSTDARVAYVRWAFAEQLGKPPASRDWTAFDAAVGPPPYPVEVIILKARSLAARGQPDAAVIVLDDARKQQPDDPDVRAQYALAVGTKDKAAGLADLDEAEKTLGDRVAFRLARAQLAGTETGAGENAGGLKKEERFALFAGLGDLSSTKAAAAAGWYAKAAAESPFDLPSRVALFRAAVLADKPAVADQVLTEIKSLDTADGPTFLVLDAIRRLPSARTAGPAAVAPLRDQAERAVKARPNWATAHTLLGELDELADDPDGALEHYRTALGRGERSDGVVRRAVQLCYQRGRFEEAKRVLDARERLGSLPNDLRQQLALVETALGGDTAKGAAAARGAANSSDPLDHLFRGQTLLLSGDRAGAAAAFDRAVTINPALIDGWVNLVRTAVGGPQAEAAVIAARADRAIARLTPPSKTAVTVARGDLRRMLGQFAEAEGFYRQALKDAPSDAAVVRRLIEVFDTAGRPGDAVPVLEAVLAAPAKDSLKRWARRALAGVLVNQPGGFAKLSAALVLVDENLAAGGGAEDERAKAALLATDPFRRPEAKKLFQESGRKGPFSPDESAAFAQLLIEEGSLDDAEVLLADATRAAALAKFDHLRLLHRVQLARGRLPQAKATLVKLKAVGGTAWEVTAEEARNLAKAGDPAAAAALVLAAPAAKDDKLRTAAVAPLLVEIGRQDDAEKLYAAAAAGPKGKNALARFYIVTGRPGRAVELALTLPAGEYTAAEKARLLSAAAASRPGPGETALAPAASWVADQLRAAPADPELLQCAAVVAEARGKYEEAVAGYEKLIEAAKESVSGRNNLALLLATQQKDASNRPLELIEAAIGKAGPRPSLLDTRAVVHIAAGRAEEAVRDLEAALRVEQKPAYYFHLALAQEKAENVQRKIVAVDAAHRLGLKKTALPPAEWPDYERLFGPR